MLMPTSPKEVTAMDTANYPSLLSHKGTLIRLRIAFDNGDRTSVEPLRYDAGGLILNAQEAGHVIDLPERLATDRYALLKHDGSVARQFTAPGRSKPVGFETFVVYPNGGTFEGPALEGLACPAVILWSTELARLMRSDSDRRSFVADHWTAVPTIVAFFDDKMQPMCPWIEHSCHDCDYITKHFVDL